MCVFSILALAILCGPCSAQIPGLSSVLGQPTTPAPSAPIVNQAPVIFNGTTIFSVYGTTPAQAKDRADLIAFRLNDSLKDLTPADPLPSATAKPVGDDVVVLLGGHDLLTVTEADASASGESVAALSAEWSNDVSSAITQAMAERSPGYMRKATEWAVTVALVAVLINILIWILMRRLLDRPGWVTQTLVGLIALHIITGLFPATRPVHDLLGSGLLRPVAIIIVVGLTASVASRMLRLILRHVFPVVPDHLSPDERTERTIQRRATLGDVSRITGVTLIWTIAVVVALTELGVNVGSLLTSAGLIGVIIGLAAQDTMKDLVAGINILVDDRFGVGDVIQIGTFSGTVERLNLRITQVRDMSGRLITFPNRSIESVANATVRWAQVDFQITVGYDTNLRQAMDVMMDVAKHLKEEWPERIATDPQMLGVDSYGDNGITLRMLVRTFPGEQWVVSRELHLRVKEAFDEHKLTIPSSGQTVVVFDKAHAEPAHDPEAAEGAD